MNPAFVILALIVLVLLWFLLAFAFKPIGKAISTIVKDALDAMFKEDK
jgi:F0F1-type ATP synthase membrane subunit b/b'